MKGKKNAPGVSRPARAHTRLTRARERERKRSRSALPRKRVHYSIFSRLTAGLSNRVFPRRKRRRRRSITHPRLTSHTGARTTRGPNKILSPLIRQGRQHDRNVLRPRARGGTHPKINNATMSRAANGSPTDPIRSSRDPCCNAIKLAKVQLV